MFGLSVWELLIVLAIVLLLFGPRRLKTLGSDLGAAIKGFRSAVGEDEKKKAAEAKVIDDQATIIDGEVRSKAEAKQD